jgi:hypothetical protein
VIAATFRRGEIANRRWAFLPIEPPEPLCQHIQRATVLLAQIEAWIRLPGEVIQHGRELRRIAGRAQAEGKPGDEFLLLFPEATSLVIFGIRGPWEPDFAYAKLGEFLLARREAGDMVLVVMRGDDEREPSIGLLCKVRDGAGDCVKIRDVRPAIDQYVLAGAADRQREEEAVAEPDAVHPNANARAHSERPVHGGETQRLQVTVNSDVLGHQTERFH